MKLCTSQRLHQALEVSDWMIEHKICCLVPEDFSARFQLIENVLGLEEAEKYFESIPENLRGESLYTALLRSYAKRSEKKYLDRASRIHIQEDERIRFARETVTVQFDDFTLQLFRNPR